MLRLAVTEGTLGLWAGRLRGARVAEYPLSRLGAAVAEFDAAVLLPAAEPPGAVVQALLQAGRHVLLAAENCLDAAALARQAAAAVHAGARLAVASPDRWLPSRRLIKQHIEAGKLGQAGLVRIHRWTPPQGSKRRTPAGLAAGLLADLDLAWWLSGQRPSRVYAVGGLPAGDSGPGGMLQVHLGLKQSGPEEKGQDQRGPQQEPATLGQLEQGGMALVEQADCLPEGQGYSSLCYIGSCGAAYADDQQNVQLIYGGGQPRAEPTGEGTEHVFLLLQEFVDALSQGREPPGGGPCWREVLALGETVQRSLETGAALAWEGLA